MVNKVFVIGIDHSVTAMFKNEGWDVRDDPQEADFLCFTGGADVSPDLYGEVNVGLSYTDPARDTRETALYNAFKGAKRFIGICRGGQFLNVMNGGKMVQDIPGHRMGRQSSWIAFMESLVSVNLHEDHHQGIVPAETGQVFAWSKKDNVCEGVWYPETRSFCFQPHPEWGDEPTRQAFFNLLHFYR
jgi:gamma-glutamyl-gamma-aminobutyrate hydrolase PuuD